MFEKFSLVPFLAIIEVMALLANNLSKLDRLIWSFRHLEHQNLSIVSDSIGRARTVKQIYVMLFRHLEHQNLSSKG